MFPASVSRNTSVTCAFPSKRFIKIVRLKVTLFSKFEKCTTIFLIGGPKLKRLENIALGDGTSASPGNCQLQINLLNFGLLV